MSTHKSFLSDQTDENISYKRSMSAHFFNFSISYEYYIMPEN